MTAIQIQNVSKRYQRSEGTSLRRDAQRMLRQWMPFVEKPDYSDEQFWALRDISFQLDFGDSLGIIGRNGSGKTTLLRLLSGISDPTEGQIYVNGRFTSLIGLGAGFDYQRSGLENIYLNAAIYGVSGRELQAVFQDIVEFSELGDFLNMPVRRYSSGMIARLGFSIAIHILPDIIFLDEVLSVGDFAFQKKCMERIEVFNSEQKTLVFVSHGLEAIERLCKRVMWLHGGQMQFIGDAAEGIQRYKDFMTQ